MRRSRNDQFVPLHFRERTRLGGHREIGGRLPLDAEPLDGSRRGCAQHLVTRSIIVDHIVLNCDVRDVYRVVDVGHVLNTRSDVIAQNGFADVTNLTKIVVFRADIELDIDLRTNRSPAIHHARTAWRQGRPADIIAAGPPRDPCRAPVEIFSRKPNPSVI